MPEMEEKLGQLFSDPESMQKIMSLAQGLMSAQKSGDAPPQTQALTPAPTGGDGPGLDLSGLLASLGKQNTPSQPQAPAENQGAGNGLDLSSLLSALGKGGGGSGASAGESGGSSGGGGGGALGNFDLAALPKLMQAFSGDTNYLKSEKVNLLKALKPYLGSSGRGPDIDRAVKMANLARAAKSALGGFLRR